MSTGQYDRFRKLLLSDSFLFAKEICGHADLVPEIHAPISYLACGLTDRLIETLQSPAFDSYVTRKLRREMLSRQIDWKTAAGRMALDELINGSMIRPAIINIRMSRRFFKSSVITHAGSLFIATVDPNETIKITHAVDPKAWEFVEQIGKTVQSGTYRDFFPDRIPEDATYNITQKRINLGGRTISHPQATIQGSGVGTKEEAAHYSTFVDDDIVTDLNSSPDLLRGVLKWMKGLTGFYMPTRRVRRIEVGTKHDEDDDDTFLTSGAMAVECLTLRVPIEEYEGEITNILERGRPTCPQLFPKAKISAEQTHVLSGTEDEDGYRTWWNQYLLSAIGGTLRLFPPSLVDDPDHWWKRVELPKTDTEANRQRRKEGHFLVSRFLRDAEGKPIPKKDKPIFDVDGLLLDDWRDNAETILFDPWRQLDRVCLIDPSWANSGNSDNWGVSAVGCDYDDVSYQLETMSDDNGTDGWIHALEMLDQKYHFRVIGFDGAAMQDAMIQQLMRNDKRLRRMAGRMVKVPHNARSKPVRMKEGVSEPMKVYRLLLAPPFQIAGDNDVHGGNMTRLELKGIKSTPKRIVKDDKDGIADSLAMARAVLKRRRKPESDDEDKVTAINRRPQHPVLGVAYGA